MKIFYIGFVHDGTTTMDRKHALERLGHELIPFDITPYNQKTRLLRSLQWRYNLSFLLKKLNADIVAAAAQAGKLDCVWIDKGVWIFADTVAYLKNRIGRVIHFTPDPGFLFWRSQHFVDAVPLYDLLVTTKSFEVEMYEKAGSIQTMLVPQSFCKSRYQSFRPSSNYMADIGFVGHCEKHYLNQVNALSSFERVKVFGDQWVKPHNRRRLHHGFSVSGGVWRDDYVSALASFKIGLGLLSKIIPEQHTTRSFEIPAAGTFLLAERTAEHQSFFKEGEEAEFFDSDEELIAKARYYLTHDAQRDKIARQGHKRCSSGGFDTDQVMRSVMERASVM